MGLRKSNFLVQLGLGVLHVGGKLFADRAGAQQQPVMGLKSRDLVN